MTEQNPGHVCPTDPATGAPYPPAIVTCGACELSWCERCDPAPSAMCHRCHGRGHTTARVFPPVDCGHAPTPTYHTAGTRVGVGSTTVTMTGDEILFPGYAVMPDGRRVCYACADTEQREEMRGASRFTAYLSTDGRTVGTWSGGKLGTVTRLTRNRRQTFVRVTDTDGRAWAGIGPAESGTYVSLRRVSGGAR